MSRESYAADAVRRSLGHFAFGKAATGLSAVVLLVVLARVLPKADYAIYVTLQGLVLAVGAVTSFGINQAVLRFLPEMRASGQNLAMYRLVWRTLGTRCLVVIAGFAACAAALPWVSATLGFASREAWVVAYMAVGSVRLINFFLSTAMETLLWAKTSQYALAAAAMVKLCVVLLLASQGALDFSALVLVEAVTETLALAALVLGLRRNQRLDAHRTAGNAHWDRLHRLRMRAFGRWNYVTSLLTQFSTSTPYRMLAAATLATESMALLGLILSVSDLLNRFLPANMAGFLLRSVLVAHASTGTGIATVQTRLNLNFRVSAFVLAGFSASALAAGSGALAFATAGKYTQTGPLLSAMGAVLLLNLWRMQFDLLTSINERVRLSTVANLGLVVGLPVAGLCAPHGGAWAFVAGASVGQLLAIGVYAFGLRGTGTSRLMDPRSVVFFLLNLGWAQGLTTLWPTVHWTVKLAGALAGLVVLALLLKPIRLTELRLWIRPDNTPTEAART